MARKCEQWGSWLKAYEKYTAGTESPPIFHLWVALGTIAGAAQRKIFLDMDYYQVHSNMYIILVSPPGRSRKSTALRIGKACLKSVTAYGQELFFSTQASSVAALVKQMSAIKKKEHQSLTSFSSELGSLLGQKSVEMTDFLVDIYDCNPDWDKQTVGRGLEKIERPWLNLIGATTPQWMGDNLSSTATEGGFIARSIFIHDDTRLRVAVPKLTDEQKIIQKALVHDLAQIAALSGEFHFSEEGLKYYTEWYEGPEYEKECNDSDSRLFGYYDRKQTHVLKVAMAVSLAEDNSLVLTEHNIKVALAVLADAEIGMKSAFASVGKNILSADYERMKQQIRLRPQGISYKQIINKNINSINKEDIDKLLATLVEAGEVVRKQMTFYPNGGSNAVQSK